MKIGLDIDDTCIEFMDPFLSWYNKKYNTGFKKSDFKEYEFWDTLGITKEDTISRVAEFYVSREQAEAPRALLAREVVEKLAKTNIIYAITSRPKWSSKLTCDLMDRNFPGLIKKVYVMGHWENNSNNQMTKADLCLRDGIDLLVDDSLKTVEDCAKKKVKAFLVNQPWNISLVEPSGV